MKNFNETFACPENMVEGQTKFAQYTNNGPQMMGLCKRNLLTGKMKIEFSEVTAIAVLLLFAMVNKVAAQYNVQNDAIYTPTTNYIAKWYNLPPNPSIINSQLFDNGTNVGI